MAWLRKKFDTQASNRKVELGTSALFDALNTGSEEDFILLEKEDGTTGGIVKKVPKTNLLNTRWEGVEDSAAAGNFVTLEGKDGDVVEFNSIANDDSNYVMAEVGAGTFPVGALVYGVADATTKKITISDVSSSGATIIGTVYKALDTDSNGNKFVWVTLSMDGARFKTIA